MQIRIAPDAKRMLERAAALQNTTISGFVVNSALEAAGHLIRERERIVLDDRDWDAFFEALADPPEPNAALRRAVAIHERLIRNPKSE